MKLFINLIFVLIFFNLQAADVKSDIKTLHDSAYALLDSNFELAFKIGQQTEEMAADFGLKWEEANSIFIQAWIHETKNESGKAFVLYLKAIELLRPYSHKLREADLISLLLSNIGLVLKEHHAHSQAHKFLDEGISVASQFDLPVRLTHLYLNKSRLLKVSEESVQAEEYANKALKYAQKSSNKENILLCLNLKGLIETDLKLTSRAVKTFTSILEYSNESTLYASKYSGMALHNIGHAYFVINEYNRAKQAYIHSLEIELKNSKVSEPFLTLTDLCELSLKTNSTIEAMNFGKQALALYPDVEILPEHYRLFDLLSQVYFEQKNFDSSRLFTQRYMEENSKFLRVQQELLRTKDQYQMELLTAGFFTQQNANRKESLYLTLLSVVTSIFTLILIAGITRQYYKRRAIKRSLIDLDLNL